MYAQKYLMALKQNIAHTLKSYGYILSYVLQPAPIVKIWDGEMRIEMLHRNKKLCNSCTWTQNSLNEHSSHKVWTYQLTRLQ